MEGGTSKIGGDSSTDFTVPQTFPQMAKFYGDGYGAPAYSTHNTAHNTQICNMVSLQVQVGSGVRGHLGVPTGGAGF